MSDDGKESRSGKVDGVNDEDPDVSFGCIQARGMDSAIFLRQAVSLHWSD